MEKSERGNFMVYFDFDRNAVLELIDRVFSKTVGMDLTWDWPCGVAYYGLACAVNATGRDDYLAALKKCVDERMVYLGGEPVWTVNKCAMGHALITLYEKTGEQKYLDLIDSKVDYLRNRALRFGENVLQHTVSAKNDFPEQAWADTLFMAAFFLLRVGVMRKDKEIIDDALNQYYWHIEFLQERGSGLWYHGYTHIERNHMSGFFWARANAWAAYTMSQVGRVLPEAYLYPQFMDVQGALAEQLAGLKQYQTEDGLWRTVLDDGEAYEELSASAGIAAAMLANGNPLFTPYLEKAFAGIVKNISEDGRLLNVSGGTAVMRNLEGYRNISRKCP